ncbi:MAG: hypothetical protein WHS87_07195 [Anaerolineales bacterium]
MPLDLFLLPLYRSQGEIRDSLPGAALFEPPRKTARGREEDRLLCYLAMLGHPVPEAELQRLLQEVRDTYYATSGSLTFALRAAALRLNQQLLERNFALRAQKRYNLGLLVLFAVRQEQAIFLQGGPTHLFLWDQGELRHFHDPESSAQGLGYAQTPSLRYGQITLQPGQRLLFCGRLPAAWENLSIPSSSLAALYRHLISLERQEIHALLMGIEAGRGAVTWLPIPSLSATAAPAPAVQEGPVTEVPTSSAASAEAPVRAHFIGAKEPMTIEPPKTQAPQAEEKAPPASVAPPEGTPRAETSAPTASSEPTPAEEIPAPPAQGPSAYALPRPAPSASSAATPPKVQNESARHTPSPAALPKSSTQSRARTRLPSPETLKPFARRLLNLLEAYRHMRRRLLEGVGRFLPRLLPSEDSPTLPPTTQWLLLLLALAIPLMVVTAATVTYFRYGRNVEYQTYLSQAQALRAQALTLQEATAQRDAWQGVLFYLEKAEAHRRSEETRALRLEAERALDQLFGILRLNFQPALSSPLPVPVTRLVAVQGDLYLLDAQNGRVLRAMNANGRFQLDEAFQCAPGSYGDLTVGALVDLLPLPDFNFYGARVLAADASGNLLYCAPDSQPFAVALPRPNANWTRLTAFALDGDILYVLDAAARAVWEYTGYQGTFERPPRFIFSRTVPPIENGIDLVAHQDAIYVLHATGTLTVCTNSRLESVPTRCESPAMLRDPFPAHQGLAEFQQVHFTQLAAGPPPGLPLLFLDDEHQAIYRFSARSLELQAIWKAAPRTLPDLHWTAFALSAENVFYLALENRIYFAPLP